jgi:2-polyprenyl-6-methoxyphenol hydroxylase-like FAD-dependent oxidoreductase
MLDVIVVGARCAGASTGLLLSRAGLRVLLVDKAKLPSDTLSTHMIHESGVARLRDWDAHLVARIRASGCPPIVESTTDLGAFRYSARHWPANGNAEAFCPRRTVLDPILLDAAIEAGCEVRTDFTFRDVVRDGDRVAGILGTTGRGDLVTERAHFVVGADGRRSPVARAVSAAEYNSKPMTTCTYYTYWADTGIDATIISPREGCAVVAVPTNDKLAVITAIFPLAEFALVKSDIERHYMRALQTSRAVTERMTAARRAERFYGTADLPFYYRTAFGPGWALVGDSGHCKDPILARGITDAFSDAEGLSQALVRGLSGSAPIDEALAAWARERDETTRDLYELTYRLSLLQATSALMSHVYAAARHNPVVASRFHGVISGALAYRDFFTSSDAATVVKANSGTVG